MVILNNNDLSKVQQKNMSLSKFIQCLCFDAVRIKIKEGFESSGDFYSAYLNFKENGYDKSCGYSLDSFVKMSQFLNDFENNAPIVLKGAYIKLNDMEYRIITDGSLTTEYIDFLNKIDNNKAHNYHDYIAKINSDYDLNGNYTNILESIPILDNMKFGDLYQCYFDSNWLFMELPNILDL